MHSASEVSINFANFTWRKSNAGYTFLDKAEISIFSEIRDAKPPFLAPLPETTSYVPTHPLQEVEHYAFARFAQLDISDIETAKHSIIEFANLYGLLTHDLLFDNGRYATPLNFWCIQIWIAKNIFRIWQAIENRDITYLSKAIIVNKDDNVYYAFGDQDDLDTFHTEGIKFDQNGNVLTSIKGMFAPKKFPVLSPQNKYILNQLASNDYVFPAQLALQKVVNDQLKKFQVNPQLLFNKYNQLTQYFMPTSLLSALWFQAFQAFTKEKVIRQCVYCKQWFDATDAKSSKLYHAKCGSNYRTSKSRKLSSVQKKLTEGLTVVQIAKELNLKPDIIELWLNEEASKNAKQNP